MAISIHPHGEEAFLVQKNNTPIGTIEYRFDPIHAKTCHLYLDIRNQDAAWSSALFDRLQKAITVPLQVSLPSTDTKMVHFLTAGGFERKRCCYEVEVTPDRLCLHETAVPLRQTAPGSKRYAEVCRLYYAYYAQTHEAVSLLTASYAEFVEYLPETVLYQVVGGTIAHYAFVDENEIAYIGTIGGNIRPFVYSLSKALFAKFDHICFEADDCDPAATALKAAFHVDIRETFDTYIRPI